MNMHLFNGEAGSDIYVCPITLHCHNPKCAGDFYLVNELPNGQELWECDKCASQYWVHAVVAKSEPRKETHIIASNGGDLYMKKCPYCKGQFQTFNYEDDLCESCSMFASCGYQN